jgi:hypothetical protein
MARCSTVTPNGARCSRAVAAFAGFEVTKVTVLPEGPAGDDSGELPLSPARAATVLSRRWKCSFASVAPGVHDGEDVAGAEAFEHDVVADTAVSGAPCGDEPVPVADDLGEVACARCQLRSMGEVFLAEHLVAGVALAADEVPGAVDHGHEGNVAAFGSGAGDREQVADVVALGESAVVAMLTDPPLDGSPRTRWWVVTARPQISAPGGRVNFCSASRPGSRLRNQQEWLLSCPPCARWRAERSAAHRARRSGLPGAP